MKRKNHALVSPLDCLLYEIENTEKINEIIHARFWAKLGYTVKGIGFRTPIPAKYGESVYTGGVYGYDIQSAGTKTSCVVFIRKTNKKDIMIKVQRRMVHYPNGIRNAKRTHARFAFMVRKPK